MDVRQQVHIDLAARQLAQTGMFTEREALSAIMSILTAHLPKRGAVERDGPQAFYAPMETPATGRCTVCDKWPAKAWQNSEDADDILTLCSKCGAKTRGRTTAEARAVLFGYALEVQTAGLA